MSVIHRVGWYFVSSIGVPLLGLFTLPLYTTRLGPKEFGVFAIGSSLAAVVSATASSISTVSLPVELNRYEGEERRRYVGAVLLLSVAVALASCVAVFAAYLVAAAAFGLEFLSSAATVLAIAGALLGSLWAICVEIMAIEGRAKNYATTTIFQALVNAMGVCLALFVFDDVENALFWGFVGASAAGVLGASLSLAGRFEFRALRRWLPVAARGGGAAVLASLAETGKTAVERSYVGLMLGTHQLGLLAHGQYYKNAAMVLINSISRALVPTSLREAEAPQPDFRITLQLWVAVQAMVVAITLGFTLIGREVLILLTRGKFVEAAPYVVAIMLTLLLQTMAKSQAMLLMARGKGHIHANLNTAAGVVALLWLFSTVPFIGIWGVITSFGIQTLGHRVAVYWAANRIHRLAFADHWVIVGFALTGLCMAANHGLGLGLMARVVLLLTLCLIMMWQLRAQFAPVLASLKNR